MRAVPFDRFPCFCCAFCTLRNPAWSSYETCPVCLWIDDAEQNEDPGFVAGANPVCLAEARRNFALHGAADPNRSAEARHPRIAEIPPPHPLFGYASGTLPDGRPARLRLLSIARAFLAGAIELPDAAYALDAVACDIDDPRLSDELALLRGVADEFASSTFELGRVAGQAIEPEIAACAGRVEPNLIRACGHIESVLREELGS